MPPCSCPPQAEKSVAQVHDRTVGDLLTLCPELLALATHPIVLQLLRRQLSAGRRGSMRSLYGKRGGSAKSFCFFTIRMDTNRYRTTT